MEHYDILIIGGGAAGIAAARECRDCRVLLADRRKALGGILLQCAHRGFGRAMTGMEYAAALRQTLPENITTALNTTVLKVTAEKTALLCGPALGRKEIRFHRLILATGCREIPMGALPIAGTRPRGVYTAGQMQEMMNLHGHIPQGPAVILGSGDLGLIMAQHLLDAGIPVTLVEQKDSCGGLLRNREVLKDSRCRLICGSTVREVRGQGQLEGCILSGGTCLPCRTLLIAAGMRPERELAAGLETAPWLQFCGNCNTVHPMVEGVVKEGKYAGRLACSKIRGSL